MDSKTPSHNDGTKIRVQEVSGKSRLQVIASGEHLQVGNGQTVEVVSGQAVRQAQIDGDNLVLRMQDGSTVVLEGYVTALRGDAPVNLKLNEPATLPVRIVDKNGMAYEKLMAPGEHVHLEDGEKIQVLGAAIPSHYKESHDQLIFTTASGETFTIDGIVSNDEPLASRISFPDIFQFGSVISGSSTVELGMTFVPLSFTDRGFREDHMQKVAEDKGSHREDASGFHVAPPPAAPQPPAFGETVSNVSLDSNPAPPLPQQQQDTPSPTDVAANPPADVTPPSPPPPAPPAPPPPPPVQPVVTHQEGEDGARGENIPVATIISLTPATDTGVSDHDSLTKLVSPTLMGTGTPGAHITVYDGTTDLGQTVVGLDGNWTFVIPVALVDGPHTFTVVPHGAIDGLRSQPYTATVDSSTQVAFTSIDGDTFGADTTGTGTDLLTDDTTQVYSGTAEANLPVTIVVTDPNGNPVETLVTTSDANGHWSIPSGVTLSVDGDYVLNISTEDPAGNTASTTATWTLDTTQPTSAPDLIDPDDTFGPHTPGTSTDNLTNHNQPTFDVPTSEGPGAAVLVELLDHTGAVIGHATLQTDSNGHVTFTPDGTLPDGDYTLRTTPTDKAGNVGDPATLDFVVDTHTNVAYTGITNDTFGADTTGTSTDLLTDDTQPTFHGTAEPGDYISVVVTDPNGGAFETLTTTADVSGHWSVQITGPASVEGTYTLGITAEDAAGNTASADGSFVLDTTQPTSAPDLIDQDDSFGPDTTGTSTDNYTNHTQPTFDVPTSEGPGASVLVELLDHTGAVIGHDTIMTDSSGHVSFMPGSSLPDGDYTVRTTPTDTAGNVGDPATLDFTVDTQTTVAFTGITNDTYGPDTTGTSTDLLTDDVRPVFHGTSEPGDFISVVLTDPNGNPVETLTTTADASGGWSVQPTQDLLTDGSYTLGITAEDKADNTATTSGTFVFDQTPPTSGPDLITPDDTYGASTTGTDVDNLTKVTTPTFDVPTSEGPGASVLVEIIDHGGTVIEHDTLQTDTTGHVTYHVTGNLADGDYTIRTTPTDTADNTGAPNTLDFTVDTTKPTSAPDLVDTNDSFGPDTPGTSLDNLTNFTKPTFDIPTSEGPGAAVLVEIVDHGGTVLEHDTMQTGLTGHVTYQVTGSLTDGDYTIRTTPTDKAGNVGDPSTLDFTVDTHTTVAYTGITNDTFGPDTTGTSTDLLTDDTRPTFHGTAEANDWVSVVLTDPNGTPVETLTTTADASGHWSVQPTGTLSVEGSYTLGITAEDAAGNTASVNGGFVLDTTAPTATPDLVDGSDSFGPHTPGTSTDNLTNATMPTFDVPTSEGPGASVLVEIVDQGGTTLVSQTFQTDSSGHVQFQVGSSLADGDYTIYTTPTDKADNTGATASLDFVIDTRTDVAYTHLTNDTLGANTVGTSTDNLTDDNRPVFYGTAEPGDYVSVVVTDPTSHAVETLTTTADTSGDWSVQPSSTLTTDGTYTLGITAEDLAGNTATSSGSFVLDTTAPTSSPDLVDGSDSHGPHTTGTSTDNYTNVTTPTFDITTSEGAGASVNVTFTQGGTTLSSTDIQTDATGHVGVTVGTSLADGTYTIHTTATDAAGNVGTDTSLDFVVDTHVNLTYTGITVDTYGVGTTGTSVDLLTYDTRPTFHGLTDPDTYVSVVLTDPNGTTVGTLTTTSDASGNWSVQPAGTLSVDGTYSLAISAEDRANNTTTASGTFVFDSTLPTAAPDLIDASDSHGPHTAGTSTDNLTNVTLPVFDVPTSELGGASVLVQLIDHLGATIATQTSQTDSTGHVAFSVTSSLADGDYTIRTTPTDTAGNVGNATVLTFTVDTQTSVAYTHLTNDTMGANTVGTTTDNLTDDTRPTFFGTAEANAWVSVDLLDPTSATLATLTTTADALGHWSVQPTGTLSTEGTYTLNISAEDKANNTATSTGSFVLDTTKPTSTPDLVDASDSHGPHTAGTSTDNLTNVTTPTFDVTTGEGAGASVHVAIAQGSTTLNSADLQTDSTGHVTLNVASSLADGTYTIHTTATDAAGNVGDDTSLDFVVDTHTTVAYTGLTNDTMGANTVGTTTDGLTDDTRPTFHGTAEANDWVSVTLTDPNSGVVETMTTTADSLGHWSVQPTGALSTEGTYTLAISAEDLAGNTASTSGAFVLDTTAPTSSPDLTSDSFGPHTTGTSTDNLTNVTTPTFDITTSEGAGASVNVTFTQGGTTLASQDIQTDSTGHVSLTVGSSLADGTYTIHTTATDTAGNVGTDTTLDFVVDTQTTVGYTGITTDTFGTGTTGTSIDRLTYDNQPVFHGTAEAGAYVAVELKDPTNATVETLTATADAGGNWSVQPSATLSVEGTYTLNISAEDQANNTATSTGSFVLDTTLPTSAPDLTDGSDSFGPHTAGTSTDNLTNVTMPTFDVPTSEGPGASVLVELLNNLGTVVDTATSQTDSTGHVSFSTTVSLADGDYTLRTTPTDTAGNVGNASVQTFTVDTQTSVAYTHLTNDTMGAGTTGTTTDNLTDDTRPTFFGTADANAWVSVDLVDPLSATVATMTTTADGTGHWSVQPTGTISTEGTYTLNISTEDQADNTSTSTGTFVLDTTKPTSTPDLVTDSYGVHTAGTTTDNLTNATTPTFDVATGETAGASVHVAITLGGTTVASGDSQTDATGHVAMAVTSSLADGTYTIHTTPTDTAGNVGNDTTLDFVVDTHTTVAYTGLTNDSMGANTVGTTVDGLTNDTRPTFHGTAEANDWVSVQLVDPSSGVVETMTTTADGLGQWSVQPTGTISVNGTYTLNISAEDQANNTATSTGSFVLDTAKPTSTPDLTSDSFGPHTTGTGVDNLTNATTPTFDVATGEGAGASVNVTFTQGGTTLSSTDVQTDSTGHVSLTVGTSLADGTYTIHTTATDAAGNVGNDGSLDFVVDTHTTVGYTGITTDTFGTGTTGTSTDRLTYDNQPFFNGTAEPGAYVSVDLKDPSNALVETLTATANASGNWSVQPSATLSTEGAYTLAISAEDQADNTATSTGSFVLDKTLPTSAPDLTTDSYGPHTAGTTTDNVTNVTTPTFDIPTSETGGASVLVELLDHNGTLVDTATSQTDVTGHVAFTTTVSLVDGDYTLRTTPTDTAGNVGNAAVLNFTVDTQVDVAYTNLSADTMGANTVGTTTDNLTKDNQPVFSGTADAGAWVSVDLLDPSNATIATMTTTADGSGNWSVQPAGTLSTNGTYTLNISAEDQADNTTTASHTFQFDNVAPTSAPDLTSDSYGTQAGGTSTDNLTNFNQPEFDITTGEGAGASVNVTFTQGGTTLGSQDVQTDSTGHVSVSVASSLADGTYTIHTTPTDAAGNVGADTTLDFVVDTHTSVAMTGITNDTAGAHTNGTTTDRLTDDTFPTLHGTAEPGAWIGVTLIEPLAPAQVLTATADASGNWSAPVMSAITDDGTYTASIMVQDQAGNVTSTADSFVLDTTVPVATPALVEDTFGAHTAGTTTDNLTKVANPHFTLTTGEPAGSDLYVEVLDATGTTVLQSQHILTDGSGTMTFQANSLVDGNYHLHVTPTDMAGNVGATAGTDFQVDTATTATVTGINTDTYGANTAGTSIDFLTDDTTLTVNGTREAGAYVEVQLLDGSNAPVGATGSVTAGAATSWSFDLSTLHTFASNGLEDGSYTVRVTTTDEAGNTHSVDQAIVIDTQTDVVVTSISSDTAGANTTGTTTDFLTKDTTLTVAGTREAGSYLDIQLLDPSGTQVGVDGSVTAGAATAWSFDLSTLHTFANVTEDGTWTVRVNETDAAGNTHTYDQHVVIDTTVPVVAPDLLDDTAGALTPGTTTDNLTMVANPHFALTTGEPAGSDLYVEVLDATGTTVVQSQHIQTDGSGTFTFQANTLAEGDYHLHVTPTDKAGNVGTTQNLDFTIDTHTSPIITGISGDSAGSNTTGTTNDWRTDNTSFDVYGTREANSYLDVQVLDASNNPVGTVGHVTADAATGWTFDLSTIYNFPTDGLYTMRVTATDEAGNVSHYDQTVTIDTDLPTATPHLLDDTFGANTAGTTTDSLTKVANPHFDIPTSELAGADVFVEVLNAAGTTVLQSSHQPTDTTGHAAFQASSLAEGTYVLRVTPTDIAGNTGLPATTTFVVDTHTTATVDTITTDTAGANTAGTTTDFLTYDTTLTVAGTREAGAYVQVQVLNSGGTQVGSTGAVTAGAATSWNFDLSTLYNFPTDGTYTVHVTTTDEAGNQTTVNRPIYVDTTAIATIDSITSDSKGANTTGTTTDFLTNDTTLTVAGTRETGAYLDIQLINPSGTQVGLDGSVTAGAATAWTFDVSTLHTFDSNGGEDGTWTVRVNETDAAGNTHTYNHSIVIDTTAPIAGLPDLAAGSDSANANAGGTTTDNLTNVTVPVFYGSTTPSEGAGADLFVEVLNSANTVIQSSHLMTNGSGSVSFTAASLAEGSYHLHVTPTDKAGNVGSVQNLDFTVDTHTTAAITGISPDSSDPLALNPFNGNAAGTTADFLTNANTFTVSGTSESGDFITVNLKDSGGTSMGTGTVTATGTNWSFDLGTIHTFPSDGSQDGNYTISVQAQDAANNSTTVNQVIHVDTATTAAITSISSDSKGANTTGTTTDFLTNDTTLTVTGTREVDTYLAIKLLDGGGTQRGGTGTVTATAGSTSWSFDVSTLHTFASDGSEDGTWTVSVTPYDAANNHAQSFTKIITIDTTVPAATPNLTDASDSAGAGTIGTTTDNLTKVTVPTFTAATGETAGADVFVEVLNTGNTVVQSQHIQTNASGSVTFTASSLADGDYHFHVTPTDRAGNVGTTANLDFTVDTHVTAAVTSISTDTYGVGTTGTTTDFLTKDGTLTVNGTGETDAIVTVQLKDSGNSQVGSIQTVTVAGGAWSLDLTTIKTFDEVGHGNDGSYTLAITSTDKAGNTTSNTHTLLIDTIAQTPTVAGLTTATDSADHSAGVGTHADNITNAATITLHGSTETFAYVEVFQNGSSIGHVQALSDGSWTMNVAGLTDPAPVNGTTYAYTAQITDMAGNLSVIGPATNVVIDRSAPSWTPTITSFDTDTFGAGTPGTTVDHITKITNPTLHGTAGANGWVDVYDGSTYVGLSHADGSGNWTLSLTTALSDGTHTYKAVGTDEAGNTTADSNLYNIIEDHTIAPPPFDLKTGDDTRIVGDDNTYKTDPTLVGTAEPHAHLHITVNGSLLTQVDADASGAWSYHFGSLADNTYTVAVQQTDIAGNDSGSSTMKLIIDTTSPTAKPVVTGITAPTDSGEQNNDALTHYTTPTLIGTSTTDSLVNVYIDGVLVNTVTSAGVNWTLPITTAMHEGGNTVTARIVDVAGNEGPASDPKVIQIDTIAPAQPTASGLATSDDTAGANTPGTTTDGLTKHNQPSLTGTAEYDAAKGHGAIVTVYDGDTALGVVTADTSGHWSLTPGLPLDDGTHLITAVALDYAGNQSVSSANATIVVDTHAEDPGARPLLASTDTGTSNSDALTKNQTPTVVGTTVPNASLDLHIDSGAVATVTSDASGHWTWTPTSTLAEGTHTLHATVTDMAGNVSAVHDYPIVVDVTPPPGIPVVTGLALQSETGFSDTDLITRDSLPVLLGTATANAHVEVFVDGSSIGLTDADATGHWSIKVSSTPLVDGVRAVTAREVDDAGNPGTLSGSKDFTVDTTVVAPVISGITAATDSGTLGDLTTDVLRPVLTGTAEAHAHVFVYQDSALLGMAIADGVGAWTFQVNQDMDPGANNFKAKQIDVAGNESGFTGVTVVTLTETQPGGPGGEWVRTRGLEHVADSGFLIRDQITNEVAIIYGDGSANTPLRIYEGTHVIGTTTTDASGNWSITSTLPEATYQVRAELIDYAGNFSNTKQIEVDLTPPGAISLGLTTSSDTGSSQTDGVTSNTHPELGGTADAGAAVQVFVNGISQGYTFADASGHWYFRTTAVLAEGSYAVKAHQLDVAGNAGPDATFTLVVDTTPDVHPTVLGITHATDTGTSNTDGLTSNTHAVIYGTAIAFQVFDLSVNGTILATVTALSDGTWSYTPGSALPNGPLTITAIARTDLAGNKPVGTPTAGHAEIDNPAPAPTILLVSTDDSGISSTDNLTNVVAPHVTGSTIANGIVQVREGASLLGTATANASGVWTLQLPTLSETTHTLSATLTNHPSGAASATGTLAVVIDVTPPATVASIAGLRAPTDAGDLDADSITSYNLPTFVGTGPATSKLDLLLDGTRIGSVVTTAGGTWSFTPKTTIADGHHHLTISNSDAAGNHNDADLAFTVDTLLPTTRILGMPLDPTETGPGGTSSHFYTTNQQPTFYGVTEPNTHVTVYAGDVVLGTALSDATGRWEVSTVDALNLRTGSFNVTAKATDVAGNIGPASSAVTLEIDVVTLPSGSATVTGLVPTDDTAPTGDHSTAVSNPALYGTGPANGYVAIEDGSTFLGYATVDGSGAWTFQTTASLTEGSHSITATPSTIAGSLGTASSAYTVAIEVGSPIASHQDVYAQTGSVTVLDGNAGHGSHLTTSDTNTAASGITYTVSASSDLGDGQLFLDINGNGSYDAGDTALTSGSTFTQADVAAGKLKYSHGGSSDDRLDATVTDGGNGRASVKLSIHHTPAGYHTLSLDDHEQTLDFSAFKTVPAAAPKADLGKLGAGVLASEDPHALHVPYDPSAYVAPADHPHHWEDPLHVLFSPAHLVGSTHHTS